MATFFITSSLMVIAILVVRFFFKSKVSFLILYPLWGLVLLRFLIPITVIESPASIMNILNITNTNKTIPPDVEQAVTPVHKPEKTNNNTNIKNTKNHSAAKQEKDTNIKNSNNIIISKGNKETNRTDIGENIPETKTASKEENLYNIFIKYPVIIWVSGSTIFFIFVIISNSIFYKRLKRNRKLIFTSNKNIPVYISDIINTPCLAGIFYPAVYFPADNNIKDKYLEHILAHEHTHIKHKDNIWALLRTICLGIYWFHPFAWIAAFYSKQDAELACDEAVLKNCTNNEKYNYGKMLLIMSQKGRQGTFRLATSLGSSKDNLKERVTMLTKKNNYKKWHTILIAAFSIVLAGCGMTSGQTATVNTNKISLNTSNYKNSQNNTTANTLNTTDNSKEPAINWAEDEGILAFEKFMKKDIKTCPEWKKFKESTNNLYFSIQYTTGNTPCLLVTNKTFQGLGQNSSHAWIYYYDTDNKKVELMAYIACSSSGEPVSITDGMFVTDTHHSYRTYTYNSNNKYTLESEEISGYFIYDDTTEKQSDNFTYVKYEWKLPFNQKTRSKLQTRPMDKYAYNTDTTNHYNVPDSLDFYNKCYEASPIIFYKNKPSKWNKFYKEGHMPLPGYYGISSGNVDKSILKFLKNISNDDFTQAREKTSIIINGVQIYYCGELTKNTSFLYYLNAGYTARAFIILSGTHYEAYGINQKEYKKLKTSSDSSGIITEMGKPEFINADFDNDGEDETAFYLTENPYTASEYKTLYIIDYLYDYSYEDYGIITTRIYGLYSYTKDDSRYFTEQLCEYYDNNPKLLSTEILNNIKNKPKKNKYKSKINIISNNGFEDYNYILSNNELNNKYEFGSSNSYNITTDNGKGNIKTSIGITYNQKGGTEKHQLNIEAILNFNDGNFTLTEPFSISTK